jgi:outer membrane lipoprotein carrier protein
VAKPARMRWSYESPEPSLVVSDGETLWIYDPGFREAQRLPVEQGFLSGAAVQFLLGQGDMRREFAISQIGACAPDRLQLELVPREPASYEKLRVVANPRTGDLAETEVHDLLGNVTAVAFSELEFNRDPAAATFRFDPPEGVTVVDLSQPIAPTP